MHTNSDWRSTLKNPALGDHIVQVYQDEEFLAEAVCEYAATGLRGGEGVIVIATPAHCAAFRRQLEALGVFPQEAVERGQLLMLDASDTLASFTRNGAADWTMFHETIGGAIAKMRLQYRSVRAYGEMVDLLWQAGRKDEAIRLEEFWNELAKLQTFALFCAYYMDNLDARSYGGPLECVCKVHTHLIPARDYERLNDAVSAASRKVLEGSLANMLLSLTASRRPATQMPLGQATLLWLQENMPRTAEKVLAEVRARRQNLPAVG